MLRRKSEEGKLYLHTIRMEINRREAFPETGSEGISTKMPARSATCVSRPRDASPRPGLPLSAFGLGLKQGGGLAYPHRARAAAAPKDPPRVILSPTS